MLDQQKCMTETEAKQFLLSRGLQVTRGVEVKDIDTLALAALDIGYPVVLKISDPEILHKTDSGGVVLNIFSPEQLTASANELQEKFPERAMLVESQAPDGGIDLILGAKRDPVFGSVIMVGFGGIYTEILADTSIHVGNLFKSDALAMVERLKGVSILKGSRGKAFDIAALAEALVILSKIVNSYPEIMEVDINPWRIYPEGGIALDALVISGPTPAGTIQRKGSRSRDDILSRMDSFFSPKSVAIVGASTRSRKAGNIIIENLQTLGFQGPIYPVNLSGGKIAGIPSYPRVADCPKPLDLVVLAVPYHQVEKVMEDVANAKVGHAIIASGGFSDAGMQGAQNEKQLVEFCRKQSIHLMGPNSIGTISTDAGFCTSIGRLPVVPPSGISIFGQSGTFSTGFALEEVTCRRRGFSKIACMGNKADVDECDFLEYLTQDPGTRCIGLYIESVGNGPRFMQAATAASRQKPTIVLKSGKTEVGARAAASHTGSLAGSDAVYDAVFRQTGLQRVDGLNDFFDVLRTFDMCPIPNGKRIGIVSITGVGCVLAADACGAYGMELADISERTKRKLKSLVPDWAPISNPADIWSTIEQRGPFEAYQKMCEIMIDDPQVDILIMIAVLLDEGAFEADKALAPIKKSYPDKPILACHLGGRKQHLESFQHGLEAIGVPVYKGPTAAVKAASFLYQRRNIMADKR